MMTPIRLVLSRNLGQRYDGFAESSVAGKDRRNDGDDAEKHDDALDEIVDDGGHVAAEDYVDAGDEGHTDNAYLVRKTERHTEQARKAVVDACGIRNQKDEDDGCRGDAKARA